MNESQQHPFRDQPFRPQQTSNGAARAKVSPQFIGTAIGTIVAFGFGRNIYKTVAETMELSTFATLCFGTLILCVAGGVIGVLAQLVIPLVRNEVNG